MAYSPDIVHQTQALMQHQHPAPQPGTQQTVVSRGTGSGNPGGPMVCYEYSYPDSNSNHTTKSSSTNSGSNSNPLTNLNLHQINRPASEHHYEQPMVVMGGHDHGHQKAQCSPGADSACVKSTLLSRSDTSSSSNASTHDRANSAAHGKKSVQPVRSGYGDF